MKSRINISLEYCDKSLRKLDPEAKKELEKFVKENLTYQEMLKIKGRYRLRPEKTKNSDSFKAIDVRNPFTHISGLKNYYHRRISRRRRLFTVFGFFHEEVFYITHIDPKGKVHH